MSTKTKTINAGPVGLKPKGAYSASATYTLLDCVLYNHDSWVCTAKNQAGDPIEITGQAPADGSQYWQALTDGGRAAYSEGETAKQKGNAAEAQGNNAATKATLANTAAQNANDKAALANEKAQLANTKATLADEKATLANTAATTANTAAQNANDKATLANTKAELAQEKATLADTKAQYAQTQGNNAAQKATLANTAASLANEKAQYAEEQGDYSKNMADHPAYIGEDNYWYIWNYAQQKYVKSSYAKGDNLDWESMTEEEKQALADEVLSRIAFDSKPISGSSNAVTSGGIYTALGNREKIIEASVATSQSIVDELT